MTAAGVALLKTEKLNLGLNAVEEVETHGGQCVWFVTGGWAVVFGKLGCQRVPRALFRTMMD